MAETIIIDALTREITVPESERAFGVAGEHDVTRKHFRVKGRTVDGNDLAVGFAWKVCTENSAKHPNEYPIDSIIADSEGIEFDWLVGKGALAYKGCLKFAVCAKQVNGEGKIQHEWRSRIGMGTVYDGIEASAEDIGGFDLRAYIQQTAEEVRQAVQDAASSADAAETSAQTAETQAGNASKAAKSAADNATAAKKSADDAAAAAKTAGDAATKVIKEGIAEKLTEMQNIQKNVSTKAQTAETAAKNAGTAKTAAQNAQKAAEKSAGNAANSESAAKTSAEQAAAARDTAQELAGRVTVDDTLSDASASPVQNKVIFAALAKKQDVQRVTFVINGTDGGLDAVVAD